MFNDPIEEWRRKFDQDMAEAQRALNQLCAPHFKQPLSAEDCALLWSFGIKAEEDIIVHT